MSGSAGPVHRIWITRFVELAADRTVDRPVLVGCLTLGLVPVALTLAFFALTADRLTVAFATAHVLAATVAVVGPSAIWYWDVRVVPRFVERTADIAADSAAVRDVTERYERVFARGYPWFAAPWIGLVVALYLQQSSFFESIGVGGVGDPAFWVYLAFGVWWGLITGIGFHGAITAIRAIRAVGDLDFDIDPLDPDGLGGLSSVGHLAIWTTMLISLGSLTLPLAFLLGTSGGHGALVYLAVAVYVVVIAVSFVYPTVYVNRRAQEVREAELEDRRERIRRLQARAADLADGADVDADADGDANADATADADDPIDAAVADDLATSDQVAIRLEIRRLRDEYADYADVNLYPLSVGIVVRLVSSIMLPVFFILFEMVLSRML